MRDPRPPAARRTVLRPALSKMLWLRYTTGALISSRTHRLGWMRTEGAKGRAALKAARLSVRTIPATSGVAPIPSGEASSLKACITGGELAPLGTTSLSESVSEEVPMLRRGSSGSGRIGSGRSVRP